MKKPFLIISFLIFSLAFSVDCYSKGGDGGGGDGHGGGHHGGQYGGHAGGYFPRGYGPSFYPRDRCNLCHTGVKGLGFGRCKSAAIASEKAAEHRAMVEEYLKNEKYSPN
jgi:hypothetical protein